MKRQTVAFSKDSTNLFFHILTGCNLSCRHCYINPEQHGRNMLDIDTIHAWLDIFKNRADKTNLILLGGEPTLHPDLHRAVRYAASLHFKSITIDTNGYLFHDILDNISQDQVDFLSFSLDGATAAINDQIRGKGCYDKVLKGIIAARKRNFSCSMIYTVSEKNIHQIQQMPDLIASLDIQRFFIQVIGMRGNSAGTENTTRKTAQVNRDTWLSVIPEIAEKIAARGITVTYPKVFLDMNEPFHCAGLVADNYFIFPNGRVYQCPICEDFPLHTYQIMENRLIPTPKINEKDLFELSIPEGCVMNKMIQPGNLDYHADGTPKHRIACCLLKHEIHPD